MIVNIDNGNPKPIEQRVQEAIIKKLYVIADNPKITVDKAVFADYIFGTIKALAKVDFDLESAVELAIPNNKNLDADLIKKQYEAVINKFSCEIDAYATYLNAVNEGQSDDEIVDAVYAMLNIDDNLLEEKLHSIMIQSLDLNIANDGYSEKIGSTRSFLLDSIAFQIRVIATCDTIEEAIEEFSILAPNTKKLKGAALKSEIDKLTKFSHLNKNEIGAYRMALSLYSQNAEFPVILATVKQLLNLQ